MLNIIEKEKTMPKYEPDKWNDKGKVQKGNNCYDYATNKRHKNRPACSSSQPGRKGKKPLPPKGKITCEQVKKSAEADGIKCEKVTAKTDCGKGCWLVALVLQPAKNEKHSNDYHWYRKDADGNWSHKPGKGKATQKDQKGKVITDPEKADRGIYTKFCGYCCVCPDKVDIAMSGVRNEAYATLILKEESYLVSQGMELVLPPGRVTINYNEESELSDDDSNAVQVFAQMYSGRKNPSLTLNEEQLETLRLKLNELPETEQEIEPRLGYHGFLINNPGQVEELPQQIEVYNGIIEFLFEGESKQYLDSHKLEEWLVTLACESDFGEDFKLAL